jgi:hypothetical protein
LDTEGGEEEGIVPEESASPEETTLEETTVEETTAEETSVEIPAEEPVTEEPQTEMETMAFVPEVQIKSTAVNTNHRPWILSDLSDMFHNLK